MHDAPTETKPQRSKTWIQFDDALADEQGRRRFTLFWLTESGLPGVASTFSTRGTRRAQCFFSDPARFADATVVNAAPWKSGNVPKSPEGSTGGAR